MVEGAESHAAYGASLLPLFLFLLVPLALPPRPTLTSPLSSAYTVWTCVGALAMLDRLDLVDADTLCWWLCERQLPCGGLNGRPEKLEDVRLFPALLPPSSRPPSSSSFAALVGERALTLSFFRSARSQVCYSWWAIASLAILGRTHWIDGSKLAHFILSAQVRSPSAFLLASPSPLPALDASLLLDSCFFLLSHHCETHIFSLERLQLTPFFSSAQDPDKGGIADRPDDVPDVFHTVFGLAGAPTFPSCPHLLALELALELVDRSHGPRLTHGPIPHLFPLPSLARPPRARRLVPPRLPRPPGDRPGLLHAASRHEEGARQVIESQEGARERTHR